MDRTTSMKRFRRVAELWNWLPVFRAVAEHKSIHGAAKVIGVSPSALSRTVRLLEDALAVELFVRHGSGLTVTPIGMELLAVSRDAMRMVDDFIAGQDTIDSRRTGPVFVGVTSPLASAVVADALLERQPREPLVVFEVRMVPEDDVEAGLLRGDLDVGVAPVRGAAPALETEHLGDARHGVYAATRHPLSARRGHLATDDLVDAPFVALRTGDGWPPGKSRRVPVLTDSYDVALTLCARGDLLCVLPDVVVAGSRALELARLCDGGKPSALYALRRKPLPRQNVSVLDDLVSSLRRVLA